MCRKEDLSKYYLEASLNEKTIAHVNNYIAHQLSTEHPDRFVLRVEGGAYQLFNRATAESISWDNDWVSTSNTKYTSLFDALCCQVQEDIAVFQMSADFTEDHLAAIHLCAPNYWSPAVKIGRPFDQVHEPVPGMEHIKKNYHKMLSSIITTKGPYTRFAWGISTDTRLNHHPEAPVHVDASLWYGRQVQDPNDSFFIRTERQNIIGLPEANAFIFTIRTYFYPLDSLSPEEKQALAQALESMSEETRGYKGLTNTISVLKEKLNQMR